MMVYECVFVKWVACTNPVFCGNVIGTITLDMSISTNNISAVLTISNGFILSEVFCLLRWSNEKFDLKTRFYGSLTGLVLCWIDTSDISIFYYVTIDWSMHHFSNRMLKVLCVRITIYSKKVDIFNMNN